MCVFPMSHQHPLNGHSIPAEQTTPIKRKVIYNTLSVDEKLDLVQRAINLALHQRLLKMHNSFVLARMRLF